MKKLILALGCLLPATIPVQAQLKHHEITVGYGFLGTSEMIGIFSDVLANAITGGNYSKTDNKWSGNLIASYKFTPTNRLGLGVTYVHTRNIADIAVYDVPSGTATTNYHTLAAEVQYNYINKTFFRLYAVAGAGITSYTEKYKPNSGSTEKNTAAHFNFQISPVGVKFGNRIGGMAEVGFGYKGLLNAGLFVRM
ncbi:MAG: hypothetical protein EOP54_05830 [Sphingobacteriales bacterium]|nr:MAG: hypothetical protein EOP54_05830 [Sphingobacteriales bacterium]